MPASFTLEKRTNKYGESPIRFSWIYNKFRLQSTLGYSIRPEFWDKEKRRVISSCSNHNGTAADIINHHILRIERIISEIERISKMDSHSLTTSKMKLYVKNALDNPLLTLEDVISEIEWEDEINDSRIRYYRSVNDEKYRYVCNAFDYYTNSRESFVIQELFGKMRKIVVPYYKFGGRKTPGDHHDVAFWEISEKEALGRK